MDVVNPQIEDYAIAHTTGPDGVLAEIAAFTQENMASPGKMGGPAEVRLLEALIVISGARRVLEVGTFTAFGALSMAAALPPDGEVITIEYDEELAAIARDHIERSEHGAKVRLIEGDAREELPKLDGPFDVVWIDAQKSQYVEYYEAVLPKLSERGIIAADNVLWDGETLDPASDEARGAAAFNERVKADERTRNVLLTVGDGLMLVWRS